MSKPVKMRFKLVRRDGSEEILEVTQVTGLRDPEGKMTTMINFDKLPDGTWRFVYNDFHIKDRDDLIAIMPETTIPARVLVRTRALSEMEWDAYRRLIKEGPWVEGDEMEFEKLESYGLAVRHNGKWAATRPQVLVE